MAKENEYKIKTMQDIVNCINSGNVDNFLIDFKGYLTTAIMLKELAELVGENEEAKKIATDGFVWIDDGKNDATISIGVKK